MFPRRSRESLDLETVLKAHFQQFITMFWDCLIFIKMLKDKNQGRPFKYKLERGIVYYDVIIFEK